MQAAEIKTQEDLKRWLESQSRETCVWIAARAAARVLPLFWQEVAQVEDVPPNSVTAMQICRALLNASSFAWADDDVFKAERRLAEVADYVAFTSATYTLNTLTVGSAASAASNAANFNASSAAAFAANHAAFAIVDSAAKSAAVSVESAAAAGGRLRFAAGDARWAEAEGITASRPLWPEGMPEHIAQAWATTRARLPAPSEDMPDYTSFWVPWYQGLLDGSPAFPRALTEAIALIDDADWKKGDLHINNEVIPRLMAEHGLSPGADPDAPESPRAPSRLRTVRAQVMTLQDFLDAEIDALRGHNGRAPHEDEILEILKDLKALVDRMIERLQDADSDANALVVVSETLPAIFEKTGDLMIAEQEPQISPAVAMMSVTIKALTDAGADPVLATKYAMGETASQKLWPRIKRLFHRDDK